jgi:trigger factor
VEANQVPTLVGEVRRGKAVQSLLEKATIKDAAGNVVDINTLLGAESEGDEDEDETVDVVEVADA